MAAHLKWAAYPKHFRHSNLHVQCTATCELLLASINTVAVLYCSFWWIMKYFIFSSITLLWNVNIRYEFHFSDIHHCLHVMGCLCIAENSRKHLMYLVILLTVTPAAVSSKYFVLIFLLMIWVLMKSFLARHSLICSSINSTFSFFSIEPNVSTYSRIMV